MTTAFAAPISMPFVSLLGLVVKRSSPTSCTLSPSRFVRSTQPSQSSSNRQSSMLMMGYLSHISTSLSIHSSLNSTWLSAPRWYLPSLYS